MLVFLNPILRCKKVIIVGESLNELSRSIYAVRYRLPFHTLSEPCLGVDGSGNFSSAYDLSVKSNNLNLQQPSLQEGIILFAKLLNHIFAIYTCELNYQRYNIYFPTDLKNSF